MARRVRVQGIKAHRCYTIKEAAECTGVTPQTVRRWVKGGLRIMVSQRPFLILGADLKAFLKQDQKKPSSALPDGHFYCLSCREKGPPALAMTEYEALSPKHGMLRGFCGNCEGPVARIVSKSHLPDCEAECPFQDTLPSSP